MSAGVGEAELDARKQSTLGSMSLCVLLPKRANAVWAYTLERRKLQIQKAPSLV